MRIGTQNNQNAKQVNNVETANNTVFSLEGNTSTPKTILLLAASPEGESRISSGEEYHAIHNAVHGRGYEVRFNPDTSRESAAVALRDFAPAVLHFSGHGKPAAIEKMGSLEVETSHGGLVFEDSHRADEVPAERLANLLAQYAATLECVFLNMCYGKASMEAIRAALPHATIIGTAPTLLNGYLAVAFAKHFYGQLGAGASYTQAFAAAKAEMQLLQHDEVAGLYSSF